MSSYAVNIAHLNPFDFYSHLHRFATLCWAAQINERALFMRSAIGLSPAWRKNKRIGVGTTMRQVASRCWGKMSAILTVNFLSQLLGWVFLLSIEWHHMYIVMGSYALINVHESSGHKAWSSQDHASYYITKFTLILVPCGISPCFKRNKSLYST